MQKTRPSIPFNAPAVTGRERQYIDEVMASGKFSGGGAFNRRCNDWLQKAVDSAGAMVTPSCTHALEMGAMLCDVRPGDEVILPSYAFTSTATAFARCGARLKFVDVEPTTMNMDPDAVAEAITDKTKAICVLHYAGVSCRMDEIIALARPRGIKIVEDAAQALLASYKGKPCGVLGDYGCYSFHETKNLHCGEGGALIVADDENVTRAEAILEKGTNRRQFIRGEVSKYTWVDIGSSYVPSELNCAFLLAQLEAAREITDDRLRAWEAYYNAFSANADRIPLELPSIPNYAEHNAHIFWVKCESEAVREKLIDHLEEQSIKAVFHYVPLHSSKAGREFGDFVGEDKYTTKESKRLLRLPLYFGIDDKTEAVIDAVKSFYLSSK